MEKQSKKGTPDQHIASACKDWRARDRALIGAKGTGTPPPKVLVDAEWKARQNMRKIVDDAGSGQP